MIQESQVYILHSNAQQIEGLHPTKQFRDASPSLKWVSRFGQVGSDVEYASSLIGAYLVVLF
jgi:hypothetical protein